MQFFKSRQSFYFLNATQFLGALNDNIFKLLVIFFLIQIKGATNATTILASAGAIFVIPFLLFSSTAGVLADRLSKRNIIVNMKFVEIAIMALSILSIYLKSEITTYILLFLMGSQSAIFGPSKYGIIPEIVPSDRVSKANGALVSLTCLATIFGTFLASFITDITNKNFILSALLCVVIAIIGTLTSFGILHTEAKKSTKKINPFFLYEVYKTLALCYKRKHLLSSVIGSGFFLFIGGFAQLNTIPFAMQSLNLTDVGGGYLFLTTAVGIAIGSLVSGKLLKEQIQLGLSCISGFFMSFLLVLLFILSKFLVPVIILLVLLGVFGGLFIVPFDSFIQVRSPKARRGQIIATANFLSFCGVLFAAFALYFIGDVLHFSSASGFGFIGVGTFIFTFIMSARMSDVFFPYLTERVLLPIYSTKTTSAPATTSLLIYQKTSWVEAIMLFSVLPNLKIIIDKNKTLAFPFISGLFNTIFILKKRLLYSNLHYNLIGKANDIREKNSHVCLFLNNKLDTIKFQENFLSYENNTFTNILFIRTEKHVIPMKFLGIRYQKRLLAVSFSKEKEKNEVFS
jgi:acyl-[acyl-carrier-protein]-phospholipid O-acyltransferase / long-chain-fatty-acid--[acyl-carrier-protein] ligase